MRAFKLQVSNLQAKQYASCRLQLDLPVSCDFDSIINLGVASLGRLHIASSPQMRQNKKQEVKHNIFQYSIVTHS